MVVQNFIRAVVATLAGITSSILAVFLIVWLYLFVTYFAAKEPRPGTWMASPWRKAVHDVTRLEPMVLLWGWCGLTAGAGGLGLRLGFPRGEGRNGVSLASIAAFFSAWGLIGAGVSAVALCSLLICSHGGS